MIDSLSYDIYIKTNFLQNKRISSDRIKLRKLMYTYFLQAFLPLKNIYMKNAFGIFSYEFVYADLLGIGVYAGNQLRQVYSNMNSVEYDEQK